MYGNKRTQATRRRDAEKMYKYLLFMDSLGRYIMVELLLVVIDPSTQTHKISDVVYYLQYIPARSLNIQ